MTDEKKPVVMVPDVDPTTDPVLGKYKSGIAARSAAARAAKPRLFGNLAEANEAFNPKKDGPMTIAQISEASKAASAAGGGGGLSPQTIQGMQALASAGQQARSNKEKKKMEADTQPPTSPAPPTPQQTQQTQKVAEAIEAMDDFDFDRMMRGIQEDVINNKREREHVNDPANNRCTEIDFSAGIAEGEFRQTVDVVPKRLKVTYRTTTPMENQAIRLWVFDTVAKDPRLDKVSSEMYGLALVVASVVQIGTEAMPDHLVRQGQGTYSANFDQVAFELKYDKFRRMPLPLIHAVGTHSHWFDLRVRQLFTTDYAKNG